MYLMSAAMESPQVEPLISCTSSKAMWDRLAVIHEQRSASHKLLISQRFHDYRMEPTDTVVQHVSKVRNIALQLQDLGENIPDVVVISKILASLPHKYRHLRSAWISVDPGRQTLDLLQERLLEEESYIDSDTHTETNALAATSMKVTQGEPNSTRRNKKPRKAKKDVECYLCQKRGHYARECPTRKQGRSNGESSVSQNVALSVSYKLSTNHEQGDSPNRSKCGIWRPSDEERKALLNTDQKDIWITDSGASAHITFRRDWFTDYRPRRDGSIVVLGDNRQCEVAGEGTIRIERLADGVWMDARFDNVLHVPDMTKNLYSGGVATERGVDIRF